MNYVQDDNRVIPDLDENHVGEFVDDQLVGVRHAVTFSDPFDKGRERFDFGDDPPFHRGGGAGAGFLVVIDENFLKVAERLVGPQYAHRYPVLPRRAASWSFRSDIASLCSLSLVSPEATRSIVRFTLPNSHSS